MDLLQQPILGTPAAGWLLAIVVTLAVLFAVGLVRVTLLRRLRAVADRSGTFFDDALIIAADETRLGLILVPAMALGARSLVLPLDADFWLRTLAVLALLVQAAIWGNALIGGWVERYRTVNLERNAGAVGTARVLSFVARLTLFSVVLLLALDNLPGVEITTLIASLGIGGIAVALAVQNILSDLFASLSIALDKPFVIGDFITVDDMSGTVEQIGLKTTRVRALGGEQIVFSNTDLLSSRVRNFQRLQERRIVFTVDLAYETSPAQIRAVPAILREVVGAHEQVRFDRAHFKEFGDFGLRFETVYFVLTPDYVRYMDVQQAVNLALIERFAAEGICFAYPAQILQVGSEGAGGARGRASGSVGPRAG